MFVGSNFELGEGVFVTKSRWFGNSLRYVARIDENIFSSSFVQDCSIFDELPLPVVHSFKTKPQSGQKLGFSSHAGFVYNHKWIDPLNVFLDKDRKLV